MKFAIAATLAVLVTCGPANAAEKQTVTLGVDGAV